MTGSSLVPSSGGRETRFSSDLSQGERGGPTEGLTPGAELAGLFRAGEEHLKPAHLLTEPRGD